jgi:hypothetical protein
MIIIFKVKNIFGLIPIFISDSLEDGVRPGNCNEDSNSILAYCMQVSLSCIETRANELDRSHTQRHKKNKVDYQGPGRTTSSYRWTG